MINWNLKVTNCCFLEINTSTDLREPDEEFPEEEPTQEPGRILSNFSHWEGSGYGLNIVMCVSVTKPSFYHFIYICLLWSPSK